MTFGPDCATHSHTPTHTGIQYLNGMHILLVSGNIIPFQVQLLLGVLPNFVAVKIL